MIDHLWKNSKFRFPFDGCDQINVKNTQAFQDIFVLTLLKGQQNGTYLEIGACHPTINNNTYLLSSNYNWNGISIDIEDFCQEWKELRSNNNFYCQDALTLEYSNLLKTMFNNNLIDYLQLDIDPATNTLEVLKKLPLNDYEFKIITFETDIYAGEPNDRVRQESRELLLNHGYQLLIEDVKVWWGDRYLPYEDWYINPKFVDMSLAQSVREISKITDSLPVSFLFDLQT